MGPFSLLNVRLAVHPNDPPVPVLRGIGRHMIKVPRFDETFQDDGDADSYKAIKAYLKVGFDGPIRPDRSPAIAGDHKGRAGMAYFTENLSEKGKKEHL